MATVAELVTVAQAQHTANLALHTELVGALTRESDAITKWQAAVLALQTAGVVPDSVIADMNADLAQAIADAAAAKAAVPAVPAAPATITIGPTP